MNQKTLFMTAAAILVAGFIGATVYYKSLPQSGQGGRDTSVAERAGAPSKGADDARVTIVEFLDPACGTCAQFYPLVSRLVQQSGGKVRVEVRYAPLHAGSDQVVKMLEAAHQQGMFWPALELLFRNQRRWVANHRSQPLAARGLLNSIPMDHAQLDADMHGEAVAGIIEQDLRDGEALGVQATPEFFVNGKPLPSFGWEQLQRLVAEAVESNY